MHKVARMDPSMGPPKCLICNRGNTPDEPDQMSDFWVMDMERDVNWGDPAYLCKYCCEKIAAEVGYVPLENVTQLEIARIDSRVGCSACAGDRAHDDPS